MMAAVSAAQNGNNVELFEKNEKLGKKLFITGKGRCNITNAAELEDFFPAVTSNPKFLYSAFYTFTNEQVISFFEELGVKTKVERGGRVFPVSDHSSDVIQALKKEMARLNVKINLNTEVKELVLNEDDTGRTVKGLVLSSGRKVCGDAVIVATGGVSYPATGSTGDGIRFAKELGLNTTALKPALCGIVCRAPWLKELQGLSLKNVRVSACKGGRCVSSFFGEMLFTHFGISGPTVLSMSSEINRCDVAELLVSIDLKPALDEQTLDKRVLRDFEKYSNKQLRNALVELLPKKLILPVIAESGCNADMPVHSVTRAQREKLVKTLKCFSLQAVSLRPIEEGIVTSGGIDVSEIDPRTMRCRKIGGLYFCGEALDVDAYTGGFNLQIAFSTGFAAGESIR